MAKHTETERILTSQGEAADRDQNMRLQLGGDPVYAHLATLATAGAINNLAWSTKTSRKGNVRLKALIPRRRNAANPAWYAMKGIGDELSLSPDTALSAQLKFQVYGNFNIDPVFATPQIDASLTKGVSPPTVRRLASSAIVLTRKSAVYGAAPLKVGIVANHVLWENSIRPRLELVHEAPEPEAFEGILNLIRNASESDDNDDFRSRFTRLARRTGVLQENITADPTRHFGFHEALGVPDHVLALAKQNFGALTKTLGLPYELPSL